MREAALRLAVDVGTNNQQPCSAARVAYVLTEDLDRDLAALNKLGHLVYEELIALPAGLSTAAKGYDSELRANVDSIRLQDEFYNVIGGEEGEGCVIVSLLSDPVDFTQLLADRTVNLVPVVSIDDLLSRFDAYTQTVGVFPEDVKHQLLDIAPLCGVQRFVPLGYSSDHTLCAPHDSIELERRMCKWIVNQSRVSIPLSYAANRASDPLVEYDVTPGTLEAVRAKGAGNVSTSSP